MNRGVIVSCRNETFCQKEAAEVENLKRTAECGRSENGLCGE